MTGGFSVINRRSLKAGARRAMTGRQPSSWLVSLAYFAIIFVLAILSLRVCFPGLSLKNILRIYLELDENPEAFLHSYSTSSVSWLLGVALSIMTGMIGVGFRAYCLKVSRCEKAGFGELFDAFGVFFKVLWLQILISVFTYLWSLLFVIPGIVASYRYSLAVYFLLDNPDMTALECISASKQATQGHKGQLFVLDLSFIGWQILCAVPFVNLFVSVYYGVTHASYYNVLSGYRPAPDGYGAC